jgi:hypothetical protein
MCQKCKDLQIEKSIHNHIELDGILNLLKSKTAFGQIRSTCLFRNIVISNFEDFDESWQFGVISLKVNCIHCANEFCLFADTSPKCTGFFSRLHGSKTNRDLIDSFQQMQSSPIE